jgi:hypothetical protein
MAKRTKTGENKAITSVAAKFAPDPNVILNLTSDQINDDWKQNVRTPKRNPVGDIIGVQGDPANPEKGVFSFAMMVDSVDSGYDSDPQGSGIREPLIVRLNTSTEEGAAPFVLVDGFTRMTAARKAAAKRNHKVFQVRAIVRDLDEKGALMYQLGTQERKELSACDTCGAVARYLAMLSEKGVKETQKESAKALHLSEQYYGKIFAIVSGLKDDNMVDAWRNAPVDIPYTAMKKLVDDNPSSAIAQSKAFKELISNATTTTNGSGGGKGRWVDRAKKDADMQGWRLGAADNAGEITIVKPKGNNDFFSSMVGVFVKINSAPTGDNAAKKVPGKGSLTFAQQHGGHVADVISAFRDGYTRGKKGEPLSSES